MYRLVLQVAAFAVRVLALAAGPHGEQSADCSAQIPFGLPQFTAVPVKTTVLCRRAYFALHDDARHVPAWISYRLTAEHALGCLPRKNTFAADPDLSHEARAKPADYHGTGFDMGHLAPDADMVWDADVMRESFYLSNMAPQLAKRRLGAPRGGGARLGDRPR